jgi:adenylate cyclase
VDTNKEFLTKLNEINEKIVENVNSIELQLELFLLDQESLFKGHQSDFKKVIETTPLLKQDTIKFLNKETLEQKSDGDLLDYLTKVRHDLRNFINVIKGYLEIIVEEFHERESLQPYLEQIKNIHGISIEILNLINEIKIKADPTHYNAFLEKNKDVIETSEKKPESEEFRSFKENYSILIVDDVKENCSILERYLNKIGYKNVRSVTDGFQALAMVKRYDLMLLDIDMPQMNGIEVLKKVKEEIIDRRLMVLMISAADTLDNLIESIKLGAEDFLTKPFNLDILRVRIGSCIEKSWAIHNENVLRQRIEFERKRYENLLHSIFPPTVVQELTNKGSIETRNYQNVAILFADVVSFTPYCDTHELEEVKKSLQEFAAMCEIVASQNNLQKIKTIGDCFLGVAGMLMESKNPVLDCIKCAQEFIRQTDRLSSKWKLHIGINYGTVIGGIVGHKQYLFDVFGDTVNTAARVQSISEPNTIYLSKEAWNQVEKLCKGQSLGELKIKGKNPLEIYLCEGILS